MNDYECRCLPGYSGKACNVLPDGTVLPLFSEHQDNTDITLVATLATIITLLMVLGCLLIVWKKKRHTLEQRKANAEAKRENELNAVSCVNKSKMLDDHMIVNDFGPKHKRINNPNLKEDHEEFYKEGKCSSKMMNTDSSRTSLMLLDKLSECSSSNSGSRTLNKAALAQFNSECSSATSSTGAPSVCSR